MRRWPVIVALALFQLLMIFSAIYLQHHYVADIMASVLYAILGYAAERLVSGRAGTAAAARPSAAPGPG